MPTIVNGYCALADLAAYLPGVATPGTLDTQMQQAINAASRAIDGYCGRRFWQDATVVTRLYDAETPLTCEVDDISTATGLIVAVDLTGYGVYDITLTKDTDFILRPLNAAFEYPVQPWTELAIVLGSKAYFPAPRQRPGVQVTAKFGWPAIPDDVFQACLIKASRLFHRKDSPQGVAGFNEFGPVRLSQHEDGDVISLLADYAKVPVG